MQPFMVRPERVEAAQRVYQEKCKKLMDPELTTLMIMHELGYYDNSFYDEDGALVFDLTELQWIAVAAAFAAVEDAGGYFTEYPNGRWRVSLSRVEVNATA